MHTISRHRITFLVWVLITPLLTLGQPVTREWVGAANGVWSLTTNWAAAGSTNNCRLLFKGVGGSPTQNNQVPGTFNYRRLTFQGTTPYTITGNTLTIRDGQVSSLGLITSSSTVTQTISAPVHFNDNLKYGVISTTSTGALSLNNITLGTTLSGLKIAGDNTAGTVTVSGAISGSKDIFIGLNESSDLKTNSRVIFSGNNSSFVGNITIQAGSLNLRGANADGGGGGAQFINVINGASLELQNNITLSGKKIQIQGVGLSTNYGAIRNVSGTNTISTDILLSNNSTITANSGTLNLANIAKYSGALPWNVLFTGNGAINVTGTIGDPSGSFTLGGLIKNGQGVLTISGMCYYNENTTLTSQGKLRLGNNNVLPATSILALQGTSEFITNGKSQTLGALRLSGASTQPSSTITVSNTNHTLRFANSRNEVWTAGRTLIISGWAGNSSGSNPNSGKIFFQPKDASTPGLTDEQLSQIKFESYCQGADLLATGELVPSQKPFIYGVTGSNITGGGGNLINEGYVGSTITLDGCQFNGGGLLVSVGGTPIPGAQQTGGNTITFVLPPGVSGAITVTTNNGSRTFSTPLQSKGYITNAANGTWFNNNTWFGSIQPASSQAVVISHANTRVDGVVANPITSLTINSGASLILPADEQLPSGSPLLLNGGTLRMSDGVTIDDPAGAGVSQHFGTLSLTADSKISLGSTQGNLYFDASDLVSWTAGTVLEIENWGPGKEIPGTKGKIFVGNGPGTLTDAQLRQIRFLPNCNGAILLNSGELVPSTAPFISSVSSVTSTSFIDSAYIGSQVTIEGCQLGDINEVKIGTTSIDFTPIQFNPNPEFGYKITFTYPPQVGNLPIELIGTTRSGFSDNSLVNLGYITQQDGNWSADDSWLGDATPLNGIKVTIDHNVTLDAPVAEIPNNLEVTADGKIEFNDGASLKVNGICTNNGIILPATGSLLEVGAGGSFINNNTIIPANGSMLKIGSNGVLTNNGSFSSGDLGSVIFLGSGTINGSQPITFYNLEMNAGTLLFPSNASPASTATIPTITGEFRINGGSLSTAAVSHVGPKYGPNSKLTYASGGNYTRGREWYGSPGSNNPSYPNDVVVSNGTTLSLDGPAPLNNVLNLVLAGNLQISKGTLKNNMPRPLEIRKSLQIGESSTVSGSLLMGDPATLPDNASNYIILHGDFIIQENSVFDLQLNSQPIHFEGSTEAVISCPGFSGPGEAITFYNVIINKNAVLTLEVPVAIEESIKLDFGLVNTSIDNYLKLGATAVAIGGNSGSFINGPLLKVTDATFVSPAPDAEHHFPVGKQVVTIDDVNNYYRPFKLTNIQYDGETIFSGEFFPSGTVNSGIFGPADFLDPILLGIWDNEWWQINRESGTGGARIAIPYAPGPTWTTSPCADCHVGVVRHNGSDWEFTNDAFNFYDRPGDPYPEAIDATASGWVYSELLSNFSPFTIGWGKARLLPITLLNFNGEVSGADILLNWQIAETKDLKHFIVEHSTDGRNFIPLGTVIYQEYKSFQWRHLAPGPGLHYYRLQMVEKDGYKSYSRVELVQMGVNKTMILGLLQNPVSGGTALVNIFSEKPQLAEAALFDMNGRMILRQALSLARGKNTSTIGLVPISSGQYRLLIRTSDGVEKAIPLFR